MKALASLSRLLYSTCVVKWSAQSGHSGRQRVHKWQTCGLLGGQGAEKAVPCDENNHLHGLF